LIGYELGSKRGNNHEIFFAGDGNGCRLVTVGTAKDLQEFNRHGVYARAFG
jgi:hypothetical protein